MRNPDNEEAFERLFGFAPPYDQKLLNAGCFSLDMDKLEERLSEKDGLYNAKEGYHLEMGSITMMDYVFEKYGQEAANLIGEMV